MCEALGVHLFPRNVPEMLLHLDWFTGIDEHELGHTHGHIAVVVNEKLTRKVTRATSEVWREDCIQAQIWGGLDHFPCCREASQELSSHVVQVRALALSQPSSCLVCLDEALQSMQQPLALNRCH